ncbi:MAG TPA: prephenate dehydratase [Phycisphaerales bacterium]|nr:prephenate dehydratase [Phycisphaerales bacterium]HRQ74794.1 prephenate dehydratase [Phycisphaerales bacterium]
MQEHRPDTPFASNDPPAGDLESLRRRIDEIDRKLVDVLSERARVVVAIGKAKQHTGTPIYAPHREQEVLTKALAHNQGPLSARTIEAIYRELMSGSFSLELPLRVGYLGPQGSFSHVAAVKHFGSSVELDDLHEIDHVFEEVAAKRCNYGLVPYENSIGGAVTDTLDAFQQHDVTIYAEALIEVSQTLLANCPANEIKRIYSKPQAFSQCRRWLSKQYPDAELIPTASSSAAVKRAAMESDSGGAAIGSTLAGELYGVKPLFEHIEDKANNVTRFLIIGREEAQPTGDDKTTLMFVTAHRPGALVDVLAVFREAGINLSHIDKRPSGRTNWEYTFFIDCDRHHSDPVMNDAVNAARNHCVSLTVLGSYPRAQRIL